MSQSPIAVTTDFSSASRQAFSTASSLARSLKRELLVIHQVQFPGPAQLMVTESSILNLEEELEKHLERLQEKLDELVKQDPAFHDLTVKSRLIHVGSPDALRKSLEEDGVSILVTATHGHTGAKRFLLGSFAARLLRTAPCPVLVDRERPAAPPSENGLLARRIFVPTDFSPHSVAAFRLACDWARTFDAQLRLHFVIEKPTGMLGYAKNMLEGWWEYEQGARIEALERLQNMISETCEGTDAQSLVTVGRPIEDILREAADFESDVIVMSTHGRSGFEEFLLGSVAERVIAKATCPVLVVPASEDVPA